ncbi:hypothetical protein Tco_1482145 [Tanacetum coccineum]
MSCLGILGGLFASVNLVDTDMSDFEDSTVTYNVVSSPFADLPDAPPSPDYVSGPEYPSLPKFVLEPVYPEFMPPEDEILLTEEQPLLAVVSPTADSPGYVPELDPEEDPEEDDDEDPGEDLADYPADRGDDGNDEDDSSDDDEDEDVDIEGMRRRRSTQLLSTLQLLLYQLLIRPNLISIRDETPISFPPREEVERLLAMPTPPSSPLSPWSLPLPQIPSPPLPPILSPLRVSPPLPQIPSPPLPVSSPVPVLSPSPPASPIRSLGYRAARIWLRAEAPSTSHSLPLPPPIILYHTRPDAPSLGTPPLHLLSTDRRADRPESSSAAAARPTRGLREDYGFVATMDREIMRDLERDVSYRITDTWDEVLVDMPGAPATDDTELGQQITEFTTSVRQDTDEIYTRLDDEQFERQLMIGRLNMLYKDRRAHTHTARLMEAKAKMS